MLVLYDNLIVLTSKNTFYKLLVKDIYKTTSDCSVVSFEMPDFLLPHFQFKQGQYLTLKAMIDGESVQRSYSLCSSPNDGEWKVAIKEIPTGLFSTYANQTLKQGDILEAMPPNGKFYVDVDNSNAKNYLLFAAGSGITPILSIIKTHLEQEPNAKIKLCYINRSVSSIILKEELEALKNQYLERLEIFYFLTREFRNIPLFDGRLDKEKLEQFTNQFCNLATINEVFVCGPEAMIFLVKDFMIEKGLAAKQIHFELFNTTGTISKEKKESLAKLSDKAADITIIDGGKQFKFTIDQGSQNILDAALANNADLPFACKGGVCCTCRAKLVKGEVDMLLNYALEEEEVKDGYILTCQSIPTSAEIIIDFDQ